MKLILSVFILLFCVHNGQSDFCQYNFSVSDVKNSVLDEVLSFIVNGVVVCTDRSVDNSKIKFWLYTRESSVEHLLNVDTPEILPKKTIVLIPGWLCNIHNDLMPELKDAYLKRYDANVVIVDWSYYASRTYGDAFCRNGNIAKAISSFLVKLDNSLNIPMDTIHIVGHSMGGQLAGLTGGDLINSYNKTLLRITGLDPAGPLFVGANERNRLDKSDARFVDVIHTNVGVLGYGPKCGFADFYPACGTSQNGCKFNALKSLSVDLLVDKIGCDHLRSVDYMIESINSNNFKAEKEVLVCAGTQSEIAYMGEDSILTAKGNSYVLKTNAEKPFAKG